MRKHTMKTAVVATFLAACACALPKPPPQTPDMTASAGDASTDGPARGERAEDEAVAILASPTLTSEQEEILSKFQFRSPSALAAVAKLFDSVAAYQRHWPPQNHPTLRALFWNWIRSSAASPELASLALPTLHTLAEDTHDYAGLAADALLALEYMPQMQAQVHATYSEATLPDFLNRLSRLYSGDPSKYPQFGQYYDQFCKDYVSASFDANKPIVRFFEGLWLVSYCSPSVAVELLKHYLFEKILFVPPAGASTASVVSPDLSWTMSAHLEAGRCEAMDLPLSTTGIENYTRSNNCRIGSDGVDSISGFTIDELSSRQDQFETVYYAGIVSYVRGGWRHGGWFSTPHEEAQTSVVKYDLQGKVDFPACSNLATCSAAIEIVVGEVQTPSDGTTTIEIQSDAIGGTQRLQAGTSLVVDRSVSKATLTIGMSRSEKHVGSYNEPPAQVHSVEVRARDRVQHPIVSIPGYWNSMLLRLDNILDRHSPQIDRMTIGEAMLRSEVRGADSFDARYIASYARLIALKKLAEAPALTMTAQERSQLASVHPVLSAQIAEKWLPTVKALVEDRRKLLAALPISSLTTAIDALIQDPGIDDAIFRQRVATSLMPLLTAGTDSQTSPGAQLLLAAARQTASSGGSNALIVARLLDVRDQLRALEKGWERDATLLSAEIAQFNYRIPVSGPAQ